MATNIDEEVVRVIPCVEGAVEIVGAAFWGEDGELEGTLWGFRIISSSRGLVFESTMDFEDENLAEAAAWTHVTPVAREPVEAFLDKIRKAKAPFKHLAMLGETQYVDGPLGRRESVRFIVVQVGNGDYIRYGSPRPIEEDGGAGVFVLIRRRKNPYLRRRIAEIYAVHKDRTGRLLGGSRGAEAGGRRRRGRRRPIHNHGCIRNDADKHLFKRIKRLPRACA